MRPEVRRDEGLARLEEGIDLERRVRPGDARRYEHVGQGDVKGDLFRRDLLDEDDPFGRSERRRPGARLVMLGLDPADDEQDGRRSDPGEGVDEERDPLVGLEVPRVEDDLSSVRRDFRSLRGDRRGGGRIRLEVVEVDEVLEEDGLPAEAQPGDIIEEVAADDDDGLGIPQDEFLEALEGALQRPGLRETEVLELLGQARVHVVEMRDAEELPQKSADPGRLLVRKDEVGPVRDDPPQGGERQERVERGFDERRPDLDFPDAEKVRAAADRKAGKVHVLPDRVRGERHGVPEVGQGLEPEINADGGAARLEKRLGSEHQDLHAGALSRRGPGARRRRRGRPG